MWPPPKTIREPESPNCVASTAPFQASVIVEKPTRPESPYIGCGTWVFTPTIFRYARETPPSARSGRLELTDVIDRAARGGELVRPFVVTGDYLNVNTVEELNVASVLCREEAFPRRKVSVVIPTYNEAASIGHVVRDFQPHVDEIVVMDNCSPDGSGEIARRLGAIVHSQPLASGGTCCRSGPT